MAKEYLEVFSSEEEKEKSPFSFLLIFFPGDPRTDARAVYSYRKNNINSDTISLIDAASDESKKEIVTMVDKLSKDFLEKFKPADPSLRDDSTKFTAKVEEKVALYLNGNNTSEPLEV